MRQLHPFALREQSVLPGENGNSQDIDKHPLASTLLPINRKTESALVIDPLRINRSVPSMGPNIAYYCQQSALVKRAEQWELAAAA
jgi:hypothetical protein